MVKIQLLLWLIRSVCGTIDAVTSEFCLNLSSRDWVSRTTFAWNRGRQNVHGSTSHEAGITLCWFCILRERFKAVVFIVAAVVNAFFHHPWAWLMRVYVTGANVWDGKRRNGEWDCYFVTSLCLHDSVIFVDENENENCLKQIDKWNL